MSNIVAIELNKNVLLVASAKSGGRECQITGAFSVDIAPDSTDSQISERLKETLSRRGLSRAEAVFVVNRQNVEMREISVPPAPDEEVPELVRFQARNEFASFNDSWSLDYVPFDGIAGGPRRVLATALSPQLMGQLGTIAESTGLRLKRILFRPYALCDLLQSTLADQKLRLIVDPNEDQTDLTITNGPALLATRSLRLQKTIDDETLISQLLSEIRRTLASSSSELGNQRIDEFLICGSREDFGTLGEQLAQAFDYPVKFVDPVNSLRQSTSFVAAEVPPHIERFASLFGALSREGLRQRHQVDFLNPRKTVVKTIDRKRTTIYASLAGALIFCSVFFAWWVLRSQDKKLTTLDSLLQQITIQNEGAMGRPGVEQIIGEVTQIDDWVVWNIDWLKELSNISQKFLTPDDAIVDSFTAELGKESAQVILKGRMAEISSGTELKSQLSTQNFSVKSGRTLRLEEDSDYQMSFEKSLFLELDRADIIRKLNELVRNRRAEASQLTAESTSAVESGPE